MISLHVRDTVSKYQKITSIEQAVLEQVARTMSPTSPKIQGRDPTDKGRFGIGWDP